jgi:hypothetical protein
LECKFNAETLTCFRIFVHHPGQTVQSVAAFNAEQLHADRAAFFMRRSVAQLLHKIVVYKTGFAKILVLLITHLKAGKTGFFNTKFSLSRRKMNENRLQNSMFLL